MRGYNTAIGYELTNQPINEQTNPPRKRFLLEKLTAPQPAKKFITIYRT
jgi:hypothetical protein